MVVKYVQQPGGKGPRGTIGIRRTVSDLLPSENFVGRMEERARAMASLKRQITRWKDTFSNAPLPTLPQGAMMKYTLHRGRPVSAGELFENDMYQWIIEQRETRNLCVTRFLVIAEALRRDPSFLNGSKSDNFLQRAIKWYYRFKKRKGLVIRRVSSSGQKVPPNWKEKLEANVERLHSVIDDRDISVSIVCLLDRRIGDATRLTA